MRFSQRIGKEPSNKEMQRESMDDYLRNGLWNVFYKEVYSEGITYPIQDCKVYPLFERIWGYFFRYHLDNIPDDNEAALEQIKIGFFKLDWFSVYDFIEYIVENIFLITSESLAQENLQRSFNNVLERELSAYRFINGTLSPITNAQEIEMINTVLNESKTEKLLGANEHLKAAQSKLSDRENPDYRNSIKESISAVESIVKLISEDSKATLGQALKLIGDKVNLHSALKEGFEKLYGWTCDGDGIRHALMEKSDLDFDDAKYMLVSCSAFVHYLIMKAQKSGIKL